MWTDELELAKKAAKAAGEFLKERKGIHIDSQDGKDLKLSSDKASEKIIFEKLEESGIPILSEEFGFKGDRKERYWIVDPLDGTVNYFKGMDDFACVSIALWEDGRPILGVVYRFMSDELFWGTEEAGAYLNGENIKTSGVENTSNAVMASGFPVKRAYDDESLKTFVKQIQCFKKVRMLGAAALMGTFVSCGRLDAYFEDGIMLWDVAAAVAVVRAAGGAATLELLEDNKCICRCFATQKLMEDYYAKGL